MTGVAIYLDAITGCAPPPRLIASGARGPRPVYFGSSRCQGSELNGSNGSGFGRSRAADSKRPELLPFANVRYRVADSASEQFWASQASWTTL